MKKFFLLFLPNNQGEIAKILEQFKNVLAHEHCDQCTEHASCTNKPVKEMLFTSTETYEEIRAQARVLFPHMRFIFMIDADKDKGYLYKGKGTLRELKRGLIANAVEAYEIITQEKDVFLSIDDIRMFWTLDPTLN